MPVTRLSAVSMRPALLSAAVAATLLAGCASNSTPKDETAGWSPAKLYQEAVDERAIGNHEKAIKLLEKLEGRAAGTPLAQQAQLDKAFAHHKAGEPAQAVATLDRFIRLHPASPALDYALYLKGLVNFNDDLGLFGSLAQQDLSERDQKAAKQSFEAFKELVERFPESRYSADARLRMAFIVNSLAQSEVHVARYYLERGAYVAAINRAQLALSDYRGAPASEEALHILIRSYEALGMDTPAKDARRVLASSFPKSLYLGPSETVARKGTWWKLW